MSEFKAELHVDVVIGFQHRFKSEIEKACFKNSFVCHVQTTHIAKLMADADLAIGAGGTAIWERCSLGLPSLCICLAENQRKQIVDAASAGILVALTFTEDLIGSIRFNVTNFLNNPALIELISNVSMKSVDGSGVFAIASALNFNEDYFSEIKVRCAVISDGIKVWPWRNHKDTRKFFFDKSELIFDEHINWWNESILDSKRILLLGIFNNVEFGVVRFDFKDASKAMTSIYLNPIMVGKSFGKGLLIKGIAWLKENYPELKILLAEIMHENVISMKLFKSVGFYEKNGIFKLELPFGKE